MTRAGLIALAAAAAALVGIIGLELGAGNDGDAVTAAGTRPGGPALPQPAPDQRDRGAEWTATVLARPLFSRDRRPVEIPGDNAASATKGVPRLAGILVSPLGRTAIFAATAGGKPVALPEGGHLGDFVVQSIDVGQVTIVGPDGRHLLRPSFDNAATLSPPAVSSPSAPTTDTGPILQSMVK